MAGASAFLLHRYDMNNFRLLTTAVTTNSIMPQMWSVAYEVRFYAFAPLLVMAVLCRTAPLTIAALAVVATYLALTHTPLAFVCLFFFVLGIGGAGFAHRVGPRLALAGLGVGLAFVASVLASPAWVAFVGDYGERAGMLLLLDLHFLKLGYSLIANATLALLAAPLMLWLVTLRSTRLDRIMGALFLHALSRAYPCHSCCRAGVGKIVAVVARRRRCGANRQHFF